MAEMIKRKSTTSQLPSVILCGVSRHFKALSTLNSAASLPENGLQDCGCKQHCEALFGNPQPPTSKSFSRLSLFPSSQCIYAFSPSPHPDSCISCPLLHNKSPRNLEAWSNNKHLLSLTVSVDQEPESSLAEC